MCTTCGCGQGAEPTLTHIKLDKTIALGKNLGPFPGLQPAVTEGHPPAPSPDPVPDKPKTVPIEEEILAKNNRIAEQNRQWLGSRNVLALNLVSAPGAGKTTLLERTLLDLKDEMPIQVLEGDQETALDALRIRKTGVDVVQVNTGTGCHLEADMVARGLRELEPEEHSLLLIENVGNLVCPALFDLGEHAKVVVLSVTEGEDKPLKYPHMFRAAQLMILTKIDLLPHVEFHVDRCLEYARQINPNLKVLQVSATKGEGLYEWYDWLRSNCNRPFETK